MSEPNSRRIPNPLWFAAAGVLVVVLWVFLTEWLPSDREQFAEPLQNEENSDFDRWMAEKALDCTAFALRNSILGMTRQHVEREIGIGVAALAGPREVYGYPMLFGADLGIEYANNRAIDVSMCVKDKKESYYIPATEEEIEGLRKALHDYEIEHRRSHQSQKIFCNLKRVADSYLQPEIGTRRLETMAAYRHSGRPHYRCVFSCWALCLVMR